MGRWAPTFVLAGLVVGLVLIVVALAVRRSARRSRAPPGAAPWATEFSSARAMEVLREIAAEPRPMGSGRAAATRDFIHGRALRASASDRTCSSPGSSRREPARGWHRAQRRRRSARPRPHASSPSRCSLRLGGHCAGRRRQRQWSGDAARDGQSAPCGSAAPQRRHLPLHRRRGARAARRASVPAGRPVGVCGRRGAQLRQFRLVIPGPHVRDEPRQRAVGARVRRCDAAVRLVAHARGGEPSAPGQRPSGRSSPATSPA